ncbi:MAG: ACP S-malonyltransferase [Vicinamibacterales bacterium]
MLAFLFPGQGAQYVGMGRALAKDHQVCRETFEEADHILGQALSSLCFDGPEDQLRLTENTQPAILATSVAVYRLLAAHGVQPRFVAGHSLGEYSANVAAGTLAFADALRLVRLRGRLMQDAVPVGAGSMAAILGLDEAAVAQACVEAAEGEVVSPANLNAPGQIVIAGAKAAVERAVVRAKALGAKRAIPLDVSAPFHCALMQPAEVRLSPELRALAVRAPAMPIVANVDAQLKTSGEEAIEALVAQVSRPVRWLDVVRQLQRHGVRSYVEVGPGTVLSGLVRKIDREASVSSTDQGLDVLLAEARVAS